MSRYSPPESYGGRGGGLMLPRLTKAVRTILVINIAVQVLQFATRGALSDYAGIGLGSFSRWSVLGVLNLVTYQFVHAYSGLGHILYNMLVLYFFGTMVEDRIGTPRFVRFYLLAGVAGGIGWLLYALLQGITVPCVGASGACYGVLIYAAILNPNAQVIFFILLVRLWWIAVGFGVIALYSLGVQLQTGFSGGVADAAHVGGMLFAVAWWRLGGSVGRLGSRWQTFRRRRAAQNEADRQRELDRLLGKINQVGMGGLTPGERRFLQRYSKDKRK